MQLLTMIYNMSEMDACILCRDCSKSQSNHNVLLSVKNNFHLLSYFVVFSLDVSSQCLLLQ